MRLQTMEHVQSCSAVDTWHMSSLLLPSNFAGLARVHCFGRWTFDNGHFPHILTQLDPLIKVVQKGQGGAAVAIIPSQQSQSSQTPGSNPAIITNPAVGSANPSQNPVASYLSSAAALELNRISLIGMSIPSMHPIGSPYHNYNSQNTSLQVPNPSVTGAITPPSC